MVTVYLIRHAQSVGNRFGIMQGQMDFPLSVRGLEQAKKLESLLPDDVTKIYSSDLRRASETARFGLERDIRHEESALLREHDFGDLSGVAQSVMDDRLPYALESYPNKDEAWPNGESAVEAYNRAKRFFAQLADQHSTDAVVAVVAHQGVILNTRDIARNQSPLVGDFEDNENVTGFVFSVTRQDGDLVVEEERFVE